MDKIHALVKRLASPMVGSRLSRQELCLSFAALHKLLGSSQFSARPAGENSVGCACSSTILASRIKKVVSNCSIQEIAMLSEGLSVMHWDRWDVVDSLTYSFYQRFCSSSESSVKKPLLSSRLGELASILEAAMASNHYFNATLTQLVEDCLGQIAVSSTEACPRATSRFLWASTSYLGAKKGKALEEELSHKSVPSTLSQFHEFNSALDEVSTKHSQLTQNLLYRQNIVQSFSEIEASEYRITEGRARSDLYSWWVGGKPPISGKRLKELVTLFVYYGFQDVVLQTALEDAVLDTLRSEVDMGGISDVINRRPELFPRVRRVMIEKIASSEADGGILQAQRAVVPLFHRALKGMMIHDTLVRRVAEELDMYTSDERAMALLVLAMNNAPLGELTKLLSAHVDSLTILGCSAVLLSIPYDASGQAYTLGENVVNHLLGSSLRGAELKDLLLLSQGVSQPLTRYISPSAKFLEGLRSLKESLIQEFLQMLRTLTSLQDLSAVTTQTQSFDDEKAVATSAAAKILDDIRSRNNFSTEQYLDALHLLAQADLISEELLELIAAKLTIEVQEYLQLLPTETESLSGDVVLRFASYQFSLDSPELSGISSMITTAAAANKNASSVLRVAAALLHCKEGAYFSVQRILHQLGEGELNIVYHHLPFWCQLLYEARTMVLSDSVIDAVQSRLIKAIGSREAEDAPVLAECDVAQFLACLGTLRKDVAPPVILCQHCAAGVLSLSPALYTSLAEIIGSFTEAEPLTTVVMESLPRMLNRLTGDQISRVVFGLSQIPHAGQLLAHQLVADIVSDYVVDNCDIFTDGKSIARMLHGFSLLHLTKRNLYAVFAERLASRDILLTMDRPSVSLAMSAFGTAKYLHHSLFDKFSRLFLENTEELSSADLLLSIKAMSRVMLMDENFYRKMGDEAAKKLSELSIVAQCDLLHAFGSVDVPHYRLGEQVCLNVSKHLDELSDPNAACKLLVSLCRMNYKIAEDTSCAAIADFITDKVDQLTCLSTASLCAVLEYSNWNHPSMVKALADHSIELKKSEQLTPDCSRGVLDLLAKNLIHHSLARNELTPLARTVSRDVVSLSEDELLEHQLLVSR